MKPLLAKPSRSSNTKSSSSSYGIHKCLPSFQFRPHTRYHINHNTENICFLTNCFEYVEPPPSLGGSAFKGCCTRISSPGISNERQCSEIQQEIILFTSQLSHEKAQYSSRRHHHIRRPSRCVGQFHYVLASPPPERSFEEAS